MKSGRDGIKERFEEAVRYAVDILEEFDEGSEAPKIAVVLDTLEDEYDAALRGQRGMDPRLVKWAVQSLLDAAQFPLDNRPDEYDPDALENEPRVDVPVFRFVRRAGRPFDEHGAMVIAFTVGAVMERFGLSKSRNVAPKLHKPLDGKVSAIDAVAEAQKRRKLMPNSESGVRRCVGTNGVTALSFEDGRLRGAADARSIAK